MTIHKVRIMEIFIVNYFLLTIILDTEVELIKHLKGTIANLPKDVLIIYNI